jgi:hypothetical protein
MHDIASKYVNLLFNLALLFPFYLGYKIVILQI